nr:unnamed protein product [Callosobruchus analis]
MTINKLWQYIWRKSFGSIAFLIPLGLLSSSCSQGLISLMFILAGDIQELIEFASFLIWFFYGVAMVSLLILRKSMKNAHRPYKVIKLLIIRSFYLPSTKAHILTPEGKNYPRD